MNFNKVNNITGWSVCFIACVVYIMTMEPTGSLWDCGEFISCYYKLQVPHPPGAPLQILMARLFTLLIPSNPGMAANLMSALASGFTILFLFWTITHFGKRLVKKEGQELTSQQIFTIMAAGAVGGLAYTFSDSFWYSAVEGEVYAMSSFFTAIVFWAILKWEHADAQAGNDDSKRSLAERWIILIFYLMGLSIGVHILNLLTIPAIVMVYYFRRYKPTVKGTILAFIVGCAITGIVQKAVIQWTISWAGSLDIVFVNDLNLPFFSGFTFFFVLLALLIWFGLRKAQKNHWRFLRLGLWSFAFMVIGYSTYITTMIRSNADPAIDMFNVDNPISLRGYLGREQYGDFPLLKGQVFTASPVDYEETGDVYQKMGDKYEVVGKKTVPVYDESQQMIFPRVWDASNDQNHANFYANWLGINKYRDQQGQEQWERDPDQADNIKFFFGYQVYAMYFRYFMWNFAGKQNDVQGFGTNIRDGNWISGINFIDNILYKKEQLLPDTIGKDNKANNKLYLLPLALGIIGFLYQYKYHRKDWLVVGLLFFFTGMAVVLYLNQAGPQPRERDYAYVGSFYAFAIWIGLGVMQVKDWFRKGLSGDMANYAAAGLCILAVPVLMAKEEWNDHDRSKKTIAPDLATAYLESCDPNAILFTFGDNDTYPLWFAQEVKGIRPDIRVINTSLLGIDWYINQLRYKINDSDPIDVIWNAEQIAGDKRNVIYYIPTTSAAESNYVDLYTMMKDQAGSDDPNKMYKTQRGDLLNYISHRKVSVPVDTNLVRQNGTVAPEDSVASEVQFDIPRQVLFKNDAAMLNIIAANKWKRPIYFTAPYDQLGFLNYIRQDGMSYRLVPVKNPPLLGDRVMNIVMNKFKNGGANKKGIFFDEENRRHMLNIRDAYTDLAYRLVQVNRKEDARKVLERADHEIPNSGLPYGMASRYGNDHDKKSMNFMIAAFEAGDTTLGKKVMDALKKDLQQQVAYYEAIDVTTRGGSLVFEYQAAQSLLGSIAQAEKQYLHPATATDSSSEIPQVINIPAAPDSNK